MLKILFFAVLFSGLSTSSAHAITSANSFDCSVKHERINARIRIGAAGESEIQIKDKEGQLAHTCELDLVEVTDQREQQVPYISFILARKKICVPRLTKALRKVLLDDLGVAVDLLDHDKPKVSASLLDLQNSYPCEVQKMRMIDLSTLAKRAKDFKLPTRLGKREEPMTPPSK